MIRLSVISGPDAGKIETFMSSRVTLGRGPTNDFALRDGLVSQYHGEVCARGDGYVFRDLKSRHGTLVRLNALTVNLHDRQQVQEIDLAESSHVIVGESLVKIECLAAPQGETGVSSQELAELAEQSGLEERVVKRSTESLDAVTRRLIQQDPRLVSIFKLSRSLNTVTEIEEVLQLIVDTTFDAFPAANFFAITVPSDDGLLMKPLIVRERGQADATSQDTLLSHSLLRQVLESQQSVLFVRDELGIQPTESIINARITACLAAPLIGQKRILGVVQADTRGTGGLFGPDDLDLFTVLASYTAFAIERAQLTDSIRQQFEGIVKLSVAAIDSRDPSTAGHSERVADITLRLAAVANQSTAGSLKDVTFSREEMTELRYAALLHDFGKIGVRESVLMKPARLTPERLEIVLERFETARGAASYDAYREALERGTKEGWSLQQVQEAAKADLAPRLAKLDEAQEFILEWQPGKPMPAEAQAIAHAMAKTTFTDSHGVERPLLLPSELVDMTIPHGTLNESEWEDMRSHARKSREFLCQIPWTDDLASIPNIAGWHHEKLNGSGYPDGITEESIPTQVRILTIADIFDAMTAADRPYRKAASFERTMDVLTKEANGGLLDPDLVTAFNAHVVPQIRAPQGRS